MERNLSSTFWSITRNKLKRWKSSQSAIRNKQNHECIKNQLLRQGSVVIQGAKCTLYADTYFQILKNKVNQTDKTSYD